MCYIHYIYRYIIYYMYILYTAQIIALYMHIINIHEMEIYY